jgi:hypothetical protein
MMDVGGIRIRSVVDRYFALLVVVGVLLAALGGYVTYDAYAVEETDTQTETAVVSTWESVGDFDHSATVVESTRTFSAGETLANRSVYFQSIAPVLDGSFRYSYTASESGDLTADTTVKLIARSVDGGGSTEYWRFNETVADERAVLESGESLSVSFSRNVTELANTVRSEEEALGGPGTTETYFLATVALNGTRNGQSVDTRRTYRLPVAIAGEVYRVNDTGPVTDSDQRTEEAVQTVVIAPGSIERYGGPLAVVAGLLTCVGLAVGRYTGRFDVTETEREYLAYRQHRSEFEEWITAVERPGGRLADADTTIETTTLAGLVDLAIDTDRRVLELADGNRYVVLDGDRVYGYTPPDPGEDTSDPLAPTDGYDGKLDEQLAALAGAAERLDEELETDGDVETQTGEN